MFQATNQTKDVIVHFVVTNRERKEYKIVKIDVRDRSKYLNLKNYSNKLVLDLINNDMKDYFNYEYGWVN